MSKTANLNAVRQARSQLTAMWNQLDSVRRQENAKVSKAYAEFAEVLRKSDEMIEWAREQVKLAEQYLKDAQAG